LGIRERGTGNGERGAGNGERGEDVREGEEAGGKNLYLFPSSLFPVPS